MLPTIKPRAVTVAVCVFVLSILALTLFYARAPVISTPPPPPPPAPPPAGGLKYKPRPEAQPEIRDNFPLIVGAQSPSVLPAIPEYNAPPRAHDGVPTPLFIGFTRNWPILQQAVVSYITAGWPVEDIYVVENTGTFDSNQKAKLTLQNPFYLDHHRLTSVLNINVVSTPTLLNFAQLQNFFMYLAMEKGYEYYFYSHMDVVALSAEDYADEEGNYQSLYSRAVDRMKQLIAGAKGKWAVHWFAYDRLTLVNLAAFRDLGGWDSMIGYYMTDCDMHERIRMANYSAEPFDCGTVYDISSSLDDLLELYRRKPSGSAHAADEDRSGAKGWGEPDERASDAYHNLKRKLEEMERWKQENPLGRNTWQVAQAGGHGEPFYKDARGFETALLMTIESGRQVYNEKWGHRDCELRAAGRRLEDPWQVEHDWDS